LHHSTVQNNFFIEEDSSFLKNTGKHLPKHRQTPAKTLANTCQNTGKHLPKHWQTPAKTLANTYQNTGKHLPKRKTSQYIITVSIPNVNKPCAN